MPNYTITIAHKDVPEFTNELDKLPYDADIRSSRQLMFARTYDMNITEEDYLFLSLRFKFLKMTMKIIKPRNKIHTI